MQELLIIDSLRELQAKGSHLSAELNHKLDNVYRWYNEQLNLLSDDMLSILNDPEYSRGAPKLKSEPEGPGLAGSGPRELELSFQALSLGHGIIDIERMEHGTRGWPGFWLHALLGCTATRLWVSEEDFDVLYHLRDVRVELFESNENAESFEISFFFTENPYFSNQRLWRRFNFGRDAIESESSEISWDKMELSESYSGFFDLFDSEVEYEHLKLALCIKDRIWRNPLKYALRYQARLKGEEEPDSEDEPEAYSCQVGSRYPFSWLF